MRLVSSSEKRAEAEWAFSSGSRATLPDEEFARFAAAFCAARRQHDLPRPDAQSLAFADSAIAPLWPWYAQGQRAHQVPGYAL